MHSVRSAVAYTFPPSREDPRYSAYPMTMAEPNGPVEPDTLSPTQAQSGNPNPENSDFGFVFLGHEQHQRRQHRHRLILAFRFPSSRWWNRAEGDQRDAAPTADEPASTETERRTRKCCGGDKNYIPETKSGPEIVDVHDRGRGQHRGWKVQGRRKKVRVGGGEWSPNNAWAQRISRFDHN